MRAIFWAWLENSNRVEWVCDCGHKCSHAFPKDYVRVTLCCKVCHKLLTFDLVAGRMS